MDDGDDRPADDGDDANDVAAGDGPGGGSDADAAGDGPGEGGDADAAAGDGPGDDGSEAAGDVGADLDPDALASALARFGGTEAERRTVARQARDLADSGKHARDRSHPLTVDVVVAELADAREGSPADRWNWWMGALAVAYGGYEPFQVHRFEDG